MSTRILITSARRYDFEDSESGRKIRGVTVNYLDGALQDRTADFSGVPFLSLPSAVELWESFVQLPGIYEAEFAQRPGKANRPMTVLHKVQYIGPVNIAEISTAVMKASTKTS